MKRLSDRTRERVRGLPLRALYRRRRLPIPPGRLMHLVAGTEDVSWFLDSGAVAANHIAEILARNGRPVESMADVLDFGCGAGRVMRHWRDLQGPAFHGANYNSDLVAWCRSNLPFAQFQVNGLGRGLASGDGSFDLIYALSVFTHLSEPLQRFWVDELSRVLRPGGFLLITTHGDFYRNRLTEAEQTTFRAGRMVVRGETRDGSNDCAVFHPEAYVRSTLAARLDVVDFLPEGAAGNPRQDVVLLRKPEAA